MKEWTIKSKEKSYSFLTNQTTLFRGSSDLWINEINDIKSYFNNSLNEIYQSNQKIIPQDYELSILSYSNQINSKSYKDSKEKVENLFFSYLELSPFYKQLIDNWEELQEEVDFLIDEINVPLPIKLKKFSEKIVKNQLITKNKDDSSLDTILNEIQLIKSFIKNKNHIFLIVEPENILSAQELIKLDGFLKNQKEKFLLFSNYNFNGIVNIKYRNTILNELTLIDLRNKITPSLPFTWSETVFSKSIPLFLDIVDKSDNKTVDLSFSSVDNLEVFIYLFNFFYFTKIPFRIDTKGVPDQYKSYIESVLTNRL